MHPDISVIIPLHNAENRISSLICHLKKQTLNKDKYEVIFIDDGSEDDTVNIIKEFVNLNDNVFLYCQKNKKQASARNNGILHATGDYILFVDDDDLLKETYFEAFYKNISICDKNIFVSKIIKKFPNNNIKKESTIFSKQKFDSTNKMINEYLINGNESDYGVWAKLYRREFIVENHIYFQNQNFFEDSLFNFEVLLKTDPSMVKEINYSGYTLIKRDNTTTNSFHPELDYLVESYIKSVVNMSKSSDLGEIDFVDFSNRVYTYVIHHHIKFDSYKTAKKISKKINIRGIFSSNLTNKYKVAELIIHFCFSLYYFLYCLRNKCLFER